MLLLLATGCGGDTDKADDSAGTDPPGSIDVEGGTLDGECPQETRVGRFVVDETLDYSFVDGQVSDAVLPTDVRTELVAAGDCRILRRENPFCDPPCGGTETCDLSGTCVAYPETVDVGVVEVFGLSTSVAMEPVQPGNAYFDTALDNPPWTPGAELALSTGSGAYPPLTLHGRAPEPLEVASDAWVLVPGEDFSVAWTPPATDSGTEVTLELRIDQHGTTPSTLVCAFADTGTGVVAAETLDVLVEAGLTGFPAGELRRRTADHGGLDGGGCVEFQARSVRIPHVDVEGYTPCRRDEDCPSGQTCNVELERCE